MGCRELQPNDCFRFVGDDKPESPFPRGNRKYKSIAEGFIITDYVDASGSVQAHYEYSPFGKITASSGAMEDDFDYRFSSEVYDSESGLVYYNYRYYSAELGRWLSRDPIGEKGGWNLYAMVGNGVVNAWDWLGLYDLIFDGLTPQQERRVRKCIHKLKRKTKEVIKILEKKRRNLRKRKKRQNAKKKKRKFRNL